MVIRVVKATPVIHCHSITCPAYRQAGGRQGSGFMRTQTFTLTAEDDCENTATCTVTYTWSTEECIPYFSDCPEVPIDLGCNPTPPDCDDVIAAAGTVYDGCGGTLTPSCAPGSLVENDCMRSQDFVLTAITDAGTVTDNCSVKMVTAKAGSITGDQCDRQQTWTITAVDECENSSVCEVVYTWTVECGETMAYCTYTQGFYGSQKGKTCNLEEKVLGNVFTAALLAQDDLVIGAGSNYIRFDKDNAVANAQLLAKILNSGGSSYALKGSCDPVSHSCLSIYMRRGSKLNNTLLVQTIVLGLNLRITDDLAVLELEGGKWMVTQEKVDCAEGSGGKEKVCDNGKLTYNPYWTTYMLDEELVSALDAFGYDVTAGGLFEMANDALGGVIDPEDKGVSLTAIAEAVDLINNVFDECRLFIGYHTQEEVDELLSCVKPESAKMDGLEASVLKVILIRSIIRSPSNSFPWKMLMLFLKYRMCLVKGCQP